MSSGFSENLPSGSQEKNGVQNSSLGEEPVVLSTFYDPVEAEIVLAKLRSAGIPCFSRHEALSVVMGLTVDGAGKQEIMVLPADLETARAALEVLPDESARENRP